jgi:uncharacterized protein (DUF305 family)
MQLSKSLISLTFYSTLFLATSTGAAYSHSFRLPAESGFRIAHSTSEAGHTESEQDHAMPEDQAMPGMNHAMPEGHAMPDADQAMPGMEHSMSEMDHGSMSLGPEDEYFDLRFIDAMILHHQGAIQMAEEVLDKSDRLSLRKMAREIIRVQGREVRRMQSWRQDWYPSADQQPLMYVAEKQQTLPMSEQMKSAMMMDMDMGTADDNFDLRFINAMLPHHQGAVAMAGEALLRSARPEIRRLSQNILSVQQQEINQMRTWRKQWYNQ